MIEADTFLLLGTVSVSIAGFASLLYSMQGAEPSRLFAWRIRYIVTGAFGMAIVSFVVVAIAQFTDDQTLIVRLAMVLLVLLSVGMSWAWRSRRDQEVFRSRAEWISWAIGNVLADGVVVVNFFVASPGLTVALWVWLVIAPTTIFINVVSGIYTPPESIPTNRTQTG